MQTVEKFLKEMEKYLEEEYHNPAPLNVFDQFEDAVWTILDNPNSIKEAVEYNQEDQEWYISDDIDPSVVAENMIDYNEEGKDIFEFAEQFTGIGN